MYTNCFEIGKEDPPLFSVVYDIERQGEILCDKLHQDEFYKNGNFSVLAVSQGSVIAKYIIEYCPFKTPIRNLVTLGGPNMGVSAYPHYPREHLLGYFMTYIIDAFIYLDIAQRIIAPADYWYDPTHRDRYLKYSSFLARANNEVDFSQERKDAWLDLNYCLFVKWANDTTIIPRESSWWGQYTEDWNIVSRFDTEVYQKDLIGTRTLEEQGRAEFATIIGDHMENIIINLNDTIIPALAR